MGSRFTAKNRFAVIAKEASLGAGASAMTAFFRANEVKDGMTFNYLENKELTGSRIAGSPVVDTSLGSVSFPDFNADPDNLGWILSAAMAEAITAVGGGEYKHTFSLSNSLTPKSFAVNILRAHKYFQNRGCVLKSFSLSVKQGEYVKGTAEFVAMSQVDLSKAFASADVTFATGTIAITAHGYAADTPVKIWRNGTATLPGGLSEDTVYYIKTPASDNFKLAATAGGTALTFSDAGTGAFEIVEQNAQVPNTKIPFNFKNSLTAFQINGTNFGEIKDFEITVELNPDTSDYRLGTGAALQSVSLGEIKVSGKYTIIFNQDSYNLLKSKYTTGTTVTCKLTLQNGTTLGSGEEKIVLNLAGVTVNSFEESGEFEELAVGWIAAGSLSVLSVDLHNSKAVVY